MARRRLPASSTGHAVENPKRLARIPQLPPGLHTGIIRTVACGAKVPHRVVAIRSGSPVGKDDRQAPARARIEGRRPATFPHRDLPGVRRPDRRCDDWAAAARTFFQPRARIRRQPPERSTVACKSSIAQRNEKQGAEAISAPRACSGNGCADDSTTKTTHSGGFTPCVHADVPWAFEPLPRPPC